MSERGLPSTPSVDGMFDRASIRTRWSSLRTRCHEEARHCQGRSEEFSADGMLDRASIRTRWSSLRTRCSMKFESATGWWRCASSGAALSVSASADRAWTRSRRELGLSLCAVTIPQPPSIRRSDFPASIRRFYLPASIRRSSCRPGPDSIWHSMPPSFFDRKAIVRSGGNSRLTADTRAVGRRLVPVIPFPSYKSCSPIGPEQSRARRARRSEPSLSRTENPLTGRPEGRLLQPIAWEPAPSLRPFKTARTDLESCQQRERDSLLAAVC